MGTAMRTGKEGCAGMLKAAESSSWLAGARNSRSPAADARKKCPGAPMLVFSTPPGWCLWLYVEKYAARTRWAHVKSNKIIDLRWGWMVLKVRVRRRGELMTEKSTQRIGSN